jgi:hypothetical protein
MRCSTSVRRHRFQAVLASIVMLFSALAAVTPAHAANQPPVISGTPATSVQVGSAYAFQPNASDPEGATLRFTITNRPWWASFSSTTGKLAGTPRYAGKWGNIQIRVSDGVSMRTLTAFTITASAATANRAPVISGSPVTSVSAGQAYSFTPSASDPDGNTLGFSIQNRPTWATFSTTTGRLSGSPTASNVGTYSNVVISVSDGKTSASLAAFSIVVKAASNAAPVISGSPARSINAGSGYSFRPTASDANGDALTFSIANRPAWATFSTSTGQLSGTPSSAQVGSYSNIVISVSDGKTSTSLSAFSIAVVDVSSGAATLSWAPPTQNTDGTTLTNLAGYRIHYGTSSSTLSQTVQIANPGATSYMIENLSPGTYYFAVKAFTSSGTESAISNLASKSIQ